VTVTVTGDVTIVVAGDTVVGGSLTGDCSGIELRGAGAFTLDGFVGNPCTDTAEEPADLKLVFDGAVTIGSTVSDVPALGSDGFLTLSDTATEGISLEPIGEASDFIAGPAMALAQAGGGMVLNRPVRGRRGASVHSDRDVALNTTVAALDGQDAPMLRVAPDCDNSGGTGGVGGSVYLASRNGVLTIDGTLQAGRGGAGGACDADASGTGMAATAIGGRGGRGGGVYVGGQQIVFGAGARIVRGSGGPGGEATAIGSDGLVPCADGFAAAATGGRGGNAGGIGYIVLVPGHIQGNPSEEGGNGGKGGLATAFGGHGRDCDNGDGGKGGDATATGGRGGDGATGAIWPAAANSHVKGDGGNAQAQGGKGGRGGDACNPVGPGGDGGMGGKATTTGGQAGERGLGGGGERGNAFGLGFGAGNGGDGGNGNPFGLGGAPGVATGDPDPVDEGKPGADGELCPLQGERRFLDLNGLPQALVEPGSYALAVLADDRATPTGETVATVVRSDGATYLKEGDLLFVGADGGLEFDVKGLGGSVLSFRATVNPAVCGEMEAGAVQLRGLVDNEVAIVRVAETDGGEAVLQLDRAAGLDDVYLESLDAPFCLDAFAIELGIEPGDMPSEALGAFVDFSAIPEGEIADDSSYCLPLVDVETDAAIADYAVLAVFDWDFSTASAVEIAPDAVGPQSFSGDGRIDFIGQILLELATAECPSPREPPTGLLAVYATVTSSGAPGSTWLRGYLDNEVVTSDSNGEQNTPERLSIGYPEPFDKAILATGVFGSFEARTGVEIRFIPLPP
jgi:hypothetical protein